MNLKGRIEKLMEHLGDPSNAMEFAKARIERLSDPELKAEIRRVMLEDGYDLTLPRAEAEAKYVQQLERHAECDFPNQPAHPDLLATKELIALHRADMKQNRPLFPEPGAPWFFPVEPTNPAT